jgi:hypothetical protein
MTAKRTLLVVIAILMVLFVVVPPVLAGHHGGVYVGVGFGHGVVHHYPHYGYYYYHHYPHYIYEPYPPVIVEHPVIVHESAQVVVSQPTQVAVQPVAVYSSPQQELMDKVLCKDVTDRRRAARDLAEFKNVSAVAVLVDVLINDASVEVRQAAAESLGKIGDPAAYEPLLRSVAAETDEECHQAAQKAARSIEEKLGRDKISVSSQMPPMNRGDKKLLGYLEDLRFGQTDIRKHAADKLRDCKGTQAVAALIDTLINDDNEGVREEAAESLGKMGDHMALPFLKTAQYDDSEKSVRKAAKHAVGKIHDTIQ